MLATVADPSATAIDLSRFMARFSSGSSAPISSAARHPFAVSSIVVLRRPKTREHDHVPSRYAARREIRQHQLELVDERLAYDDILRPLVGLIVRHEVAEHEVRGKW